MAHSSEAAELAEGFASGRVFEHTVGGLYKKWDGLREDLALVLDAMGDNAILIVGQGAPHSGVTGYYVQSAGTLGAQVEAVSDAFLSPDRHLSPEQLRGMADLGWYQPAPDGNFQLIGATDAGAVAAVLQRTLADVYRIRRPSEIWVQGWAE